MSAQALTGAMWRQVPSSTPISLILPPPPLTHPPVPLPEYHTVQWQSINNNAEMLRERWNSAEFVSRSSNNEKFSKRPSNLAAISSSAQVSAVRCVCWNAGSMFVRMSA